MDEAGHTSEISPSQPDQPPAFVLVGMSVPLVKAKELTWEFLQLKKVRLTDSSVCRALGLNRSYPF